MPTDEPRLSLREHRRIQTREHLLSVATSLFTEQGYASTSVEDIISAAGASRATLYAYFSGKEAILSEVIRRMWDEGAEFYEAFGELEDWTEPRVRSWVAGFAAEWERTAARNRSVSAAGADSVTEQVPAEHRRQVALVRQREALWSRFSEADADARALMLILLCEGYFTSHFAEPGATASPALVEQLTSALRDLLRAET